MTSSDNVRFKGNQLTWSNAGIHFVKIGGSDPLDSSSKVLLLSDLKNHGILNTLPL